MDTGERLAAYLSGDLEPDERTALEAELAGDPALRARLDRLRRSDEALASLRDVDLPEGFADRLQQRLAPELDAVLGDELAARRARRGAPRWVVAAAGAAAAVAVVAGGIGIVSTGSGDDAAESADGDAGVAMDGAEETGMAESMLRAPEAGPLIADRGRQLDRDDLTALAQDPDVQAALTSGPVSDDPVAAARDYAAALGMPAEATGDAAAEGDATETGAQTESLDEGATDAGAPPAPAGDSVVSVATVGEVSDEERAAVAACLPVLYEATADPVVPLYAELAEDTDGTPVVVFAALAPDADGSYRRIELWMLDRASCEPRLFVQADAQPVERNAP